MVIGIVGSGKMGQDMLKYFLDYETDLVLVCRSKEKQERIKESIGKQLRRKLKRGLLDDEKYQDKLQRIVVTEDYGQLSSCNLVIETVLEELPVKREVMNSIEQVVGEHCVIATNTSSIPLEEIYCNSSMRQRCIGLHFFYPVKITGYVEINCMDGVSKDVVDQVRRILTMLQIKEITLHGEGTMVINRIITTIVSFACEIHREGQLGYGEIDTLIKQQIMMFGAFELVDSTGFYIISKSIDQFRGSFEGRYDALNNVVQEEIRCVEEKGYLGDKQTGGFLQSEQVSGETANEAYKKEVVERMKAVILNDLAFYCNREVAAAKELFDAVTTILGFNQHPIEMFSELGEARITKLLEEEYARTGWAAVSPQKFACYLN